MAQLLKVLAQLMFLDFSGRFKRFDVNKRAKPLRILFLTGIIILLSLEGFAGEEEPDTLHHMRAIVEDGDTLYIHDMEEVEIKHDRGLISRIRSRSFTRLMEDIEKTMPYAQLAGRKINEIDSIMMTIKNDAEREAFLDSAEDKLMDEFEEELKSLNRRQGLLLIKLIDRETGDTTYNLIREYRSRWSAWFWQGLARVFRMNLKEEYDAEDEEDIENAISILGYDEKDLTDKVADQDDD